MNQIHDPRITKINGVFLASCRCGTALQYTSKVSAFRMLERGACRGCKKDYRTLSGEVPGLYKRDDGKWCCQCSGCEKEQAYTRKDHAKQSIVADWQCKACVQKAKGFSSNRAVGDKTRVFKMFKGSAENRGIDWQLTEDEMFAEYKETCALTGWPLDLVYHGRTASLDRIDNSKGYIVGNVQWVHVMVNMCRNKYDLQDFIGMCRSVANKVKW